MSVPNPFPLLKEQGYQRGLVMWRSVCPKAGSCHFQALISIFISLEAQSGQMYRSPLAPGWILLQFPGYSFSFGFTCCSPTMCPKGLGKPEQIPPQL